MATLDLFQQHRSGLLGGSPAQNNNSSISSFEQNRQRVLSSPVKTRQVSTQQVQAPVVSTPESKPNFLTKLIPQLAGKPQAPAQPNIDFNPQIDRVKPTQAFDLEESKQPMSASLSPETLKLVGEKEPGIIQKSFDAIFSLPDKGIRAAQEAIVKRASQIEEPDNDKILSSLANAQTFFETNPVFDNPLYRGVQKSVAGTLLGSSEEMQKTLNERLPQPVTVADKTFETIGQVIGGLATFYAGGASVKALGAGKATLPILFATIGQTSAGPDVDWKQRIAKVPVDIITGYILSSLPQVGGFTKEWAKQAGQAGAIYGISDFISSMIEGMDPKEAGITAAKSALIAALFHATFTSMQSEVRKYGAEYTPAQARERAIEMSSNKKATEINKQDAAKIMKAADLAESSGKNIRLNLVAAEQSPVVKFFNKFGFNKIMTIKTPSGAKWEVGLVDKAPAIGTGETPAASTTSKQLTSPEVKPVASTETALTSVAPTAESSGFSQVAPTVAPPANLRDANKAFNRQTATTTSAETLAGNREAERLDNDKNIAQSRLGIKNATPTTEIPIYRGGVGPIQEGDFVTSELIVAQDYVSKREGAKIFEKKVQVQDLVKSGGLKSEFIYAPKASIKAPETKVETKPAEKITYDYSSTQLDLPKEEAAKFSELAKSIPEAEISKDPDNPGRETEPHITVLYGLDTQNVKDIVPIVETSGPIEVTLGKTSIFENEKFDVVKVDVESPQLSELNKKLADSLETPGATFKDFKPHITIAYVNKGEGAKYAGDARFQGDKITLNELTFSKKDGGKEVIKLEGKKEVSEPSKDVEKYQNELRDYYSENLNKDEVAEAFYQVWTELDMSQAGQRFFNKDGQVIGGAKSSFPDFIPDELKIKKLFDAVMEGFFDPSKLQFPPNSAPRKQDLYENILGEIDSRSGLDSSEIIKNIKESYAREKELKKPTSGSTKRGSRKPAEGKAGSRASTDRFDTELESLSEQARKFKSVEEFIDSQGNFRDGHVAPSFDDTPVKQRVEDGGDFSLAEVVKGYHTQPKDYFDPQVGPRYYMYNDQIGMESLTAINSVKRGAKTITAYRAIPKEIKADKLIDGDWISFSKKYVVDHGESRFGEGEYKIIKQEVKPTEVWWDGNDIREWGYDTGKTKSLDRYQLINIWNKANGYVKSSPAPKLTQPKIITDPYQAGSYQRVDILDEKGVGIGHISYKADGNILKLDMIRIDDSKYRNKGFAAKALDQVMKNTNTEKVDPMKSMTAQGREFLKSFRPTVTSEFAASTDEFAQLPEVKGQAKAKAKEIPINLKIIEFPEMLKLFKEITGLVPKVMKLREGLHGSFNPITQYIKLNKDIFANEKEAARTFAHEIGHLVDFVAATGNTMKRGNLLGRLASLKSYRKSFISAEAPYDKDLITEADKKKLMKEAREEAKQEIEITEEIAVGKQLITPKEILDIFRDATFGLKDPELLAYIKKLSNRQKAEIARAAMNNQVLEWVDFMRNITKTVTRKVIKNAPKDVYKIFKEKLKEEIKKRNLVNKEIVTKELKDLSFIWRPFDPKLASPRHLAYRNSSEELYADAISVLFNDPVRLQQDAPVFYRSFFNYLDNKPDASEVFFDAWALLNQGEDAVLSSRIKTLNEMFKSAEDKFTALQLEREKVKRDVMYELKSEFIYKYQKQADILKAQRKRGITIDPEDNPQYALNEYNYLGGKIKAFLDKEINPWWSKLADQGIKDSDIGKILFLERIIGERKNIANPLGFSPSTAKPTLEKIKQELGEEKMKIIDADIKAFRESYKKVMEDAYKRGELYSKELYDQMSSNDVYAAFRVQDYIDKNVSAKVYKQIGTLKDIENPFVTTMAKMIATIRATERAATNRKVIDNLKKFWPNEISLAKTRWNGRGQAPIPPEDESKGLVLNMEQGKAVGYYVDKEVARMIEFKGLDRTNIAIDALAQANSSWFRPIFTGINLGFFISNTGRDFTRIWKASPDLSPFTVLANYFRALPAASRRVRGILDKDINDLEAQGALSVTLNDITRGMSDENTQLESLLNRYLPVKKSDSSNPFKKAATNLLLGLETIGNIIETVPKVATYYTLSDKMEPKELANFIREKGGSPDFLRRGFSTSVTNPIFLFSNAMIQGTVSDYDTATNPKTRSGYWFKTFFTDILPKLLMKAAVLGLFGSSVKYFYDNISDYDKTNYNPIPLGIDENGKSVYFPMVSDQTGAWIGGMIWKMLNLTEGKTLEEGLKGMFAYGVSHITPSLSPAITAASTTMQFLQGQNPYDTFRGREIIPDDEFKAGGIYALVPFLKYQFQSVGGSILFGASVLENSPKGNTSVLENVINAPIVSNVLRRLVRVSNYGQSELNRAAAKEEARKQAIQRIEDKNLVDDAVRSVIQNGSDKNETQRELVKRMLEISGKSPDTESRVKRVQNQFNLAVIKGNNDPNITSLMYAATNGEKAAILKRLEADMEPGQFDSLLKEAIKSEVIGESALILFKQK